MIVCDTRRSIRFVSIRQSGLLFVKEPLSVPRYSLPTSSLPTKIKVRQADEPRRAASEGLLGVLLADESEWRHSQFIQRIVRRLGCRDFDELWDHSV